jgi:hypothetical protein
MQLNPINRHITRSTAGRFGLLAVAVLISAGVAFGAVELARPSAQPNAKSGTQGPPGPPGPTVAQPLATPAATRVSMTQATATFGSPVALPSTSAVQPSDAGPVWEISNQGGTIVAVTFPSRGIFVEYSRPAPYSDPASEYKGLLAEVSGSHLAQLNGTTPALYVPANVAPWTNAVDFQANGAGITVYGNNDEATLEAIAQSILTQLTSSSSAGTSSSPRR